MKRITTSALLLCLVLPLLLISEARAQATDLDSAGNHQPVRYAYHPLCDSLNIALPDFQTVDLELRIWSFKWNDGSQRLVLVQKLRDGSWQSAIRDFYYYSDERYNFYGEHAFLPIKTDWANQWTKILEEGYLELPTQQELNARIIASGEELFFITNDQSYTIEVLTAVDQRNISYADPRSYHKYYKQMGLEVGEYARVIAFLAILKNEFVF